MSERDTIRTAAWPTAVCTRSLAADTLPLARGVWGVSPEAAVHRAIRAEAVVSAAIRAEARR